MSVTRLGVGGYPISAQVTGGAGGGGSGVVPHGSKFFADVGSMMCRFSILFALLALLQ